MELKPCKFCGSEKVRVVWHGYGCYATCGSCHCRGPYVGTKYQVKGISKNKEIIAAKLWNGDEVE